MRVLASLLFIVSLAACNDAATGVGDVPTGDSDVPAVDDTAGTDFAFGDLVSGDAASDLVAIDLPLPEETPDNLGPACEPGKGCFLDPCGENGDCQSGWCVDHMGDGVCTITCTDECPAGWSCQQVAGTDPDVIFICVSDVANLCRPCAGAGDCQGTGGVEDVCVDYASEGSFCGAPCDPEDIKSECPWGFTCQEALTVDGIPTNQCVADAGVCPCTAKAIALALWTPCAVENEWGACAGKRVCSDEGLSLCDAAAPVQEVCNDIDDDCDNDVDEPHTVGGDYVPLCDDGNSCTDDTCDGEAGCVHLALDGTECQDGDPCTVADHCDAGVCVATPLDCDDGEACTEDLCTATGGCEFVAIAGPCNDGDPCTVAEQCIDGVCVQGIPVLCNDGNPCTADSCGDDGECNYEPTEGGCEDGDGCTVADHCENGICVGGGPLACDDVNVCTEDVCDPLVGCVYTPAEGGCDDGNACTLGDHCEAGICAFDGAEVCEDGNICTDDGCDPAAGCVFVANTSPCDDGDPCTLGDHCVSGGCVAGQAPGCDDGNPCTTDTCGPDGGCINVAADGPCDDGNECTVGDHCEEGACAFDGPEECDDDNLCTDDTCDPGTGCVFSLNSAPCDDDDACTLGDHCHLGGCIAGGALACSDDNPCTDDGCLADGGCFFTPNSASCDDGNACTTGDHCALGGCVFDGALECDDDNVCTADDCAPATGCVFALNSAPCDDDDVCTIGDHCHLGGCISDGILTCDDGNVCTDDACDAATGCTFTANAAACDDADPCTTGDHCAGGWCLSTTVSCDDENVCTDDACGPAGCTNVPNSLPCPGGLCVNGACVCQPICDGKDCGADGCGGSCGTCSGQDLCVDDLCVCQPDCQDFDCGDDGCGGSCGVCTGQDVCVVGICVCQPDCMGLDCGDDGCGGSCGTCQGSDTCVGGTCVSAAGKLVFATSTKTTAGLGGVAGADSYCQVRASAAGLAGSWRAWLSLSGNSVSQRFAHSSVPYELVDGTVIANNWADLTDGTIQHAISRDEFGGAVGSEYIWTATKADGSYNTDNWGGCGSPMCGGFTIGGSCQGGTAGFGGDSGQVASQWTDTVCGCCNNVWRLYCFEQ